MDAACAGLADLAGPGRPVDLHDESSSLHLASFANSSPTQDILGRSSEPGLQAPSGAFLCLQSSYSSTAYSYS
jgi:hypothetical protein